MSVKRRESARVAFQGQLVDIEGQTLIAFDLAAATVDRATECLMTQDMELAQNIVAADDELDNIWLDVHDGILSLLARQAPVAGDLRLVAALLEVIMHIERIGDLCVNIAKLVPLAGHEPPTDRSLLDLIGRMGAQVRVQVQQSKIALADRNPDLAENIGVQDDVLDELNRECFRRALELGNNADSREWAMHMMLVARYLERMGDHTVDIGEQTAFVVTGRFREFTDASRGRDDE